MAPRGPETDANFIDSSRQAAVGNEHAVPDVFEELGLGEHARAILQQEFQELERLR
jgi:hypothetical protein